MIFIRYSMGEQRQERDKALDLMYRIIQSKVANTTLREIRSPNDSNRHIRFALNDDSEKPYAEVTIQQNPTSWDVVVSVRKEDNYAGADWKNKAEAYLAQAGLSTSKSQEQTLARSLR